ncbi:MAG: tetratricopeptide repeat protein [Crocosphaera sp.]
MSSEGNSTYKEVYILKEFNNFTPIKIKPLVDKQGEVKQGGEGKIYEMLSDSSLVAKIYHKDQLKPEHKEKLPILLEIAEKLTIPKTNSFQIAWCVDLVYGSPQKENLIGFLMPEVKDAEKIFNAYNQEEREQKFQHFNYYDLYEIAFNLAKVFQELHKHNIVIGDVNESNFLVTKYAEVVCIDIDSFQIYDRKEDKYYKCTVGTPGYKPPELNSYQTVRKPEHDLYGLGVLIYKLLMGGMDPFPEINGQKQKVYQHSRFALPFEALHPEVRHLMKLFINYGYRNPQERPSAEDWVVALQEAKQSFKRCSNNERHYYQQHLQNCLWCERAYKKFDAFPPMSGYKFYDPTKTSPYDDQRKYKKTFADDNQAISKLNPKLAEAYNNRGIVYYEQGKYEKALAEYNQAIQLNPQYFEAYCNRGVIYYEQGKYEKALADCNQAIQLNPKDASVYYNRGLTYKANRNIEKAISDFEKAAELYKQQANQEWYQNSLDELKGLSRPKPSSTFYNYPSTSKKRQPKTSIKSSSSPLLSFFVGVSGFVFPWSLRFLVLVSSFTGIIAMFLARSALALLPFVGIAFVCSLLLGVIFNRWNFCRALSMWMLGWGALLGLGYGLFYMLIGIFAGSKLIASGFIYFCFGYASMALASFLIDRWGWKN